MLGKAKQSVWWPGLGKQLENVVRSCHICSNFHSPPTEPMISTIFLQFPWQKVGTDLFTWKSISNRLLIQVYWSCQIVIWDFWRCNCQNEAYLYQIQHSARSAILQKTSVFAWQLQELSQTYSFKHTACSPRYPARKAERAIGIF